VRARRSPPKELTAPLFEGIAGKGILAFHRGDPEAAPPSSKGVALVHCVDPKPKRRPFELLPAQGMQANQQATFFSDGGETVPTLPQALPPEAGHIPDWFPRTLNSTALQRCARGLPPSPAAAVDEAARDRSRSSRTPAPPSPTKRWSGARSCTLRQRACGRAAGPRAAP
jgi:hypothetical protein